MATPFGFSISDIARGIKLAREIYNRCCVEDQSGNFKYRQFLEDIQALGHSLERLQSVVQRYEQQYPRRAWHRDSHDGRAREGVWPQLVGNFNATLRECDHLLAQHGYLRRSRASVSGSIRWWLSAEDRAENLMARLKWHMDKIEFYTRPSELDALMQNGSEIQNLRRQVANLERRLFDGHEDLQELRAEIVSEPLKGKLRDEFHENRPIWSVEGNEWPLKEAFSTLAFFFAAGTVKFNPAPDAAMVPEVSQYLGLAKSVWILEEIKASRHYQDAAPESVWADRMRQFEDDIRSQVHRFENAELEKPPWEELQGLSSQSYSIITYDNDTGPCGARDTRLLEDKLLDIQLPSDSSNRESSLLVYRQSDNDFRIVTSTKQADTLVAQYDNEFDVDMERDRLVPTYENPFQGTSPLNNLLVYNYRGRKPREFRFSSRQEVRNFQRALTNYRVHHEMPVGRWCINGSKTPGELGKGLLQLWQFKPLPPLEAQRNSVISDLNHPIGSRRSPSSSLGSAAARESTGSYELRRASTATSGRTILSQSSVMSPVKGSRSDGVEFMRPIVPALVIMTSCNQKFSFLHLTLNADIHIEPKACGCRNPNRHCNRVVLESKKYFPIRMLSVDHLEDWDLSVFRMPQTEKIGKTTVNERVKTLDLQFGDEAEKDVFIQELVSLENVRTINQYEYNKRLKEKREKAGSWAGMKRTSKAH